MKTYKFFQDCKIKVWDRTHFTIEANSYEEAVAELERHKDTPVSQMESNHNIVVTCNELQYDTQVQMKVSENEGFSTIDLYNDKCEEIMNNATI
ncbi:hypothetical protein HCH04_15165 [Bacteroides thetaiotaomicron]|uniref:hypothetical protein n=1 Tax=Bacteroides thetaiotaomicron TaxID=818 RepID=UPI001C8C1CCB|nr:hypothetical protein [Bacteroides thetaiotaomicron]MBX9049652.1 hypothetical protein [Bacteroides thetaiotaomicron]MBX9072922.1 hypothetical protein [Bacteroides thetaiotaomicron]